jgi:hypothetical protein
MFLGIALKVGVQAAAHDVLALVFGEDRFDRAFFPLTEEDQAAWMPLTFGSSVCRPGSRGFARRGVTGLSAHD